MPLLPVRPNPLCLRCAFALRSQLRPQGLLPRIQIAHRVDGQRKPNPGPKPGPKYSNQRRDPKKDRQASDPLRGGANRSRAAKQSNLFAALRHQLESLHSELTTRESLHSLQLTHDQFNTEWLNFNRSINVWIKKMPPDLVRLANDAGKENSRLKARLRYQFHAQVCGSRFTAAELENQNKVADLRYPSEWFPSTRMVPRTVHMHVGPTNSGKTYRALKRLEEAKKGIYLGPLRLLAHEVYTRLNAKGKPCALVTGEEHRMPEGQQPTMYSCTVEMAPLNSEFDVAIIDEIQMINHRERGWAWTQAFLGLQAKEIHLCGEARTVPLMREICALVGDKIHIHEYQRLSPLKVEQRSLKGDLRKLQKGDCVVAFSVLGIHALRRDIEKKTGKKCAIVYGSLPPETRAQQARLFNDPDNDYDFLVASDAVGMGLNLAIKRVIFESTMKSNGFQFVPLETSEVKQIGGRAGRYKTAHQAVTSDSAQTSAIASPANPTIDLDDKRPAKKEGQPEVVGWVTTLFPEDHPSLVMEMSREPKPIRTAGLFPPSLIVERFANYFPPNIPFSYILTRLHEICQIHPRFHLCELKDQLMIADTIHTVKNLSVQDRTVICASPLSMKDEQERAFLTRLAQAIAAGDSLSILEIEMPLLAIMDSPPARGREYLWSLERLHKMLVCYIWLSYRFPNVLTPRALANYAKKLVEDKIETALTTFSYTQGSAERIRIARAQFRKEIGMLSKEDSVQQTEDHEGPEMGKEEQTPDNRWTFGATRTRPPPSKESALSL